MGPTAHRAESGGCRSLPEMEPSHRGAQRDADCVPRPLNPPCAVRQAMLLRPRRRARGDIGRLPAHKELGEPEHSGGGQRHDVPDGVCLRGRGHPGDRRGQALGGLDRGAPKAHRGPGLRRSGGNCLSGCCRMGFRLSQAYDSQADPVLSYLAWTFYV